MDAADFLDLARRRQSVRGYSPRPVEKEKIERCLEAARLAPSACNTLGYPADEKIRPKIRKELARMVRWNSYR